MKRFSRLWVPLVFYPIWAFGEAPMDTIKLTSAVLESLGASQRPFRVGEKLLFSIEWGFIKAGDATLEVRSLIAIRASPATS